jgi:hypothetical protein
VPEKNTFCVSVDIVRKKRDKAFAKTESKIAGTPLTELVDSDYDFVTTFPCREDVCVFSKSSIPIKFEHPLKERHIPGYDLPPCFIDAAPFSFCPAPYRWMIVDNYESITKKENLQLRPLTNEDKFRFDKRKRKIIKQTWIYDVRLQKLLLDHFWNELEERKSLVAFYVNSTPAAEDKKRVIIGLGRLDKIYKMSFFGTNEDMPGPNPAWQRQLSHNYPEEGFRLPYQEYLEQGLDTQEILVTAPEEIDDQFKFVAEHVSDGAMLSLVEKIGKSIEIIINDVKSGKVKLIEDWEKHRRWLQKVIEELWDNRGQYPGIGSVLQFLGFSLGQTYQKEVLVQMQKLNLDVLQHTIDILEGNLDPEEFYRDDFDASKQKWTAYSSDLDHRRFLNLLMRMELSEDQVERLIKPDLRLDSGIKAEIREMIDNPYIICENDKGRFDEKGRVISDKISLDTIDQAMVPSFNIKGKYKPDDNRRVRAIMIETLKEAKENGDTLLSMKELIDNVHSRFSGERECKPDLFMVKADKKFFEKELEFVSDDDKFVALRMVRGWEKFVSQNIRELIQVKYKDRSPNWSAVMNKRFGRALDTLEESARIEKTKALEILYRNKFSVLTGRAGTGKTEIVSLLIEGIIQNDEAVPSDFLVLAPTGKASVRLKKNFSKNPVLSRIEPKTIHSHLNESGWQGNNFELKEKGGTRTSVETVIVDECSMLPIDLLATLIKSLNFGNVKRFILVGDPNQLPPIGPGRPLDDIVNWLKAENARRENLADLKVRMRHGRKEEKGRKHVCLQLADGFLRDLKSKDVEEVYSLINQGRLDPTYDLFFAEWKDYDDLMEKLESALQEIQVTDFDSYVKSVGLADGDFSKSESWQVLSPLKHREVSGTISLNSFLQNKFLANTLTKWRARDYDDNGWRCPTPFGKTKDVVQGDKVIQTRNTRQIWCSPKKSDPYLANGEIGIVESFTTKKLDVVFSDQPNYRYSFFNGEGNQSVETNLELAYAITIHKAQGSDFEKVIVIIPERAFNISMEMMYTALTRFKGEEGKTFLLVQGGIDALENYRRANRSDTDQRNTYLFTITVRDDVDDIPYAENRIHRTKNGFYVRSKSEVIVANELINAGIDLTDKSYENKLPSKTSSLDYKLPDFTFMNNGKKYYWEHLGMLQVDSYKRSWERKYQWYKENGYAENLITSEDGLDGSINSKAIDEIIQKRLSTTKS